MDREALFKSLDDKELEHFFQMFTKLKSVFRDKMKEDFKRSLPFADEFFDRWERAEFLDFGKGSSIYDSALVFGNVNVGSNTWIGPFTIIDGSGGLEIGNHCSISAGVHIYTHDSVQSAISGGEKPYEYGSVKIGNNCYIGPNAVIAKGVELGDGTIVGANSFVNNSFGKHSKIAGNPAKQI